MDLSPIEISELNFKSFKLVPNNKESIVFIPYIDGDYMIVEYEPWDLFAYANNREDLIKEISDNLYVIWTEYAEEEDSNLETHSLKLKKRLLLDLLPFKSSDPIID